MKKILLILTLSIFATLQTTAAVTVEETTDAEHLINAGFSQGLAEDVFMSKNRALGNPIEPLYETSQNTLVKAWKKFFAYIDPSQKQTDMLHHDIKLYPTINDL